MLQLQYEEVFRVVDSGELGFIQSSKPFCRKAKKTMSCFLHDCWVEGRQAILVIAS